VDIIAPKKENINSRNIKYLEIVNHEAYIMSYFRMPNNKWYLVMDDHDGGTIDNIERSSFRDVDRQIRELKENGVRIFEPHEIKKYLKSQIPYGDEHVFYDTKVTPYAFYFHGKGNLSVRAEREVRDFKRIRSRK